MLLALLLECALPRPLAFPLTLDLLLFSEPLFIGETLVHTLDDLRELAFQPACRGLGPAADARRVSKAKQLELQETGGHLVVLAHPRAAPSLLVGDLLRRRL